MNRNALHSALRSPAFNLSLIITALYAVASTYAGAPAKTTLAYSALFAAVAGVWLAISYRSAKYELRLAARTAAEDARVAQLQAGYDEAAERRDVERDVERADHEVRLAEIARTGSDPGPTAAMLEIQHRRQAALDAADEDYRIERAARQARIARRQKQGAAHDGHRRCQPDTCAYIDKLERADWGRPDPAAEQILGRN